MAYRVHGRLFLFNLMLFLMSCSLTALLMINEVPQSKKPWQRKFDGKFMVKVKINSSVFNEYRHF